PVALDQLLLPGDRFGVRLAFPGRPRIALLALAVVGGVVAPEDGQPPVAELPDAGPPGGEEGRGGGGDDERARAPRGVLREPLQRAEVEVIRRLIEEEE